MNIGNLDNFSAVENFLPKKFAASIPVKNTISTVRIVPDELFESMEAEALAS